MVEKSPEQIPRYTPQSRCRRTAVSTVSRDQLGTPIRWSRVGSGHGASALARTLGSSVRLGHRNRRRRAEPTGRARGMTRIWKCRGMSGRSAQADRQLSYDGSVTRTKRAGWLSTCLATGLITLLVLSPGIVLAAVARNF
jgi:hypothetical protein